jgi:NADPH2:quinone reductase
MRAVWYDRQGPAREVLVLGEMEKPTPARGEALIRIHASGVNPSDTFWRGGTAGAMKYPRIVTHSDGAGVIEAVGPGVPETRVGQRVWFYNGQRNGRAFGSCAEYISLDADLVSLLPDHVSFAEGATLGIPGMTAHRCLFQFGPVQGRTVLITGGAGAVGLYAVLLAKWTGAQVITTVSTEVKAARVREAGADHVINYKTEDVLARIREITNGEGVDHVVDVDLGGNLAVTIPALKNNGTLTYYATRGDWAPKFPAGLVMSNNISIAGMVLPASPHPARKRAQEDISQWIATGKRMLNVAQVFPIEETAAAHELVETWGKDGTVVVAPS